MCGIFGIWKLADKGYDFLPLIKQLMVESKGRGQDATGVAYLHEAEGMPRKLFYHKLPIPPQQYAEEAADEVIPSDFKAIIVHNRNTTQGNWRENKNNHPFVSSFPFALIHNGVIYSKYKGDREPPGDEKGPVTTDTIELFLEIEDEIHKRPKQPMPAVKRAMVKHEGVMTIATLFKNCIVIGKHSNPCWLAYLPEQRALMFASTDDMLNDSLGVILEATYTLFRPSYLREMENDTVLKINDKGITLGGDLKFAFKTKTSWDRRREERDKNRTGGGKGREQSTFPSWTRYDYGGRYRGYV